MLELAPASYSAPDRPPVVEVDGCRIYVHIHDAEYMRQRSDWRKRIAAAHPDRGGRSSHFCQLITARSRWQDREAIWYARLGLLPPDGFRAHPLTHAARLYRAARNRPALAAHAAAESEEV